MANGSILGDIDIAQLLVVVFVLFFFGLVLHLRTEDKREGYPLVDPAGGGDGEGFPPMPAPKTFQLLQGGVVTAPHPDDERPLAATRVFPFPGSSLDPTGDPLADGVGPAAYVLRRPEPLWFSLGVTQMAPLRAVEGWSLAKGDLDPRGMAVVDLWGQEAGIVRDLWIDRGVKILRYLEVETPDGGRTLLPIHHTDVRRYEGRVRLRSARASQVAQAPRTAAPDVVTAREEDEINAFYAGAQFFNREASRPAPKLAWWERGSRSSRAVAGGNDT